MDEVVYGSLIGMAEQVRAGEISPLELVEAHLARIERLNPKLNAFASVDAERARARAKAAEVAAAAPGGKNALGSLHGVPVTVKSSIDVAGLACECGSVLRKGYTPETDAPLVARLRGAGAIILGNTNVPEFLMAYESDNSMYGRVNNPWDLARTAGGSSGGESAAIAAGCSAGGVGSDGGGSIRIPAHFTGICGLKPTPGRIPSTGHFPGSAGPFAYLGVVGPMARTVRDVERLFEVMAGPDPGDPSSAPVGIRRWKDDEIRRLRVAYFEDDGSSPVTPETAAAVRKAADALRSQGFEVEPWRPENLDRIWQYWWNLFGRAGQMAFSPMLDGEDGRISPLLRDFRARVAADGPLSATELLNTLAWARRAAQCVSREDGEVSDFVVPGVCGAGVSSWRARMDGGGAENRILESDGVFAVVQFAGSSRGGGAGGEVAGGIADWGAGGGTAVGRRGCA